MEKSILEKKLIEIHHILESNYHKEKDIGALSGLSGISLFYFYYSKYLNIDSDIGLDIISNCIDKINTNYDYPTFCTGIAGLAWVCDHLEKEKFIEIDNDILLSGFDDYLYKAMINDFKKNNYDFLHGGIGYAFYFLTRYENTSSKRLKNKYQDILLEVIYYLRKLSEKEGENKIKWASIIDRDTNEQGYNLSLSHGMSSIIGILTKLHEKESFKEATSPLLKGAINYILSFKNLEEKDVSVFPDTIPRTDKKLDYNSRLAWCYGDLGIGIRLWFAAKTLNNEELKATAISILKHTALRVDKKETKVLDASICHGSYGNAQIFNRMYKETNIKEFKTATNFWIQDGINKAIHKDGYAGYKQLKGNKGNWESETNLLEGVAGIGLVIIDYLSDFDSNWDTCLMIS